MKNVKKRAVALILASTLSGCGLVTDIFTRNDDAVATGPRVEALDVSDNGDLAQSRPIALGAPVAETLWSHRGNGAAHSGGHLALTLPLRHVFSARIGEAETRRARITASPVSAGGVIFAMDARARVTAIGANGDTLWTEDLTPLFDAYGSASGGGLTVSGDTLYVTTGFGELIALETGSGAVRWRQNMDAPGSSAPTVRGDLVYIVSRDSRAWAIERSNGKVRWTLDATPAVQNFAGGAGVATSGDLVVFPFASGELIATFPDGGLERWRSVVSGERAGQSSASFTDISSDPIVANGRVYVANVAGQTLALDAATGTRLWSASEGASAPMWLAGGSLFFVNDLNQLVRLNASNGETVWRVSLPQFEEEKERRRKTRYAHHGPVVAGGRVILASSDGVLRAFNPENGALTGSIQMPAGAASQPIVVNGALYVMAVSGELLAFR